MERVELTARFVIAVEKGMMSKMKDFYGRGLGFQLTDSPGFLIGKQEGEGCFIYSDGKNPKSANAVLRIEVSAGFSSYCEHLRECGANFIEVVRMPAGYFAHFRDPSNNLISAHCPLDDPESDVAFSFWKEFQILD